MGTICLRKSLKPRHEHSPNELDAQQKQFLRMDLTFNNINDSHNKDYSLHSIQRLSSEALQSLQSSSDKALVNSYHAIRHFITPAICLFSMGALIFTLIFLHRRKLVRVTALIYLKFMGFVDLMSLVVLFISSLDYFMISEHVEAYYTSAFIRCLYSCLLGLLLASNWLMTAQAIERTVAISRPFKAKQIREKHRRLVVSVICVLSVLLTIPTLVLDVLEVTRYRKCWTTSEGSKLCVDLKMEATKSDNVHNMDRSNHTSSLHFPLSSKRSVTSTSAKAQRIAPLTVYTEDSWPDALKHFQAMQAWVVHFLIFFVVPFVFLCLASFCLLSAVRMSGRFVRQHCIRGGVEFRNTLREETRMTVLILCLIGAFFICQSPFVAYSACHKVGILSSPSPGHSLLRAFITLALALKSDCTFVFHCWLNQRFALALRRMLCSFSASAMTGGRCTTNSKSQSVDGGHSGMPSHSYRQTRSLVKHHDVQPHQPNLHHQHQLQQRQRQQQPSSDCANGMKILLREIDQQRKNASYLNQNYRPTNADERARKAPRLNLSRPVELIQFGLKRGEKLGRLPCGELRVPYGQLQAYTPTVCDGPQDTRLPSGETDTTEAPSREIEVHQGPQRRPARLRPYRFYSENDISTSCISKGCYCDLSCPVGSSCSSTECSAGGDMHGHCGCPLSKSQLLPSSGHFIQI